MEFQIVRNKLNRGQYESVKDWGRNVRFIWFKVKSCYQPKKPSYLIAKQLEQWFARHFQKFPTTEMDNWLTRFQRAQKEDKALIASMPPEESLRDKK
jgi:tRNA(Ile)-lysidine synthase TilS/MesJ